MATQVLEATPLVDVVPMLAELGAEDTDATLYIAAPLSLATYECPVVGFALDDEDLDVETEDWIPPGFEYLLEAYIAGEAATAVEAGSRERAAAVVYYAIFDAWLPVGDHTRPAGGKASWGSSAEAAAVADLMTASERRARFPDVAIPTREQQWSVAPGDVVELMVWFASPGGPVPDTRPVRIDTVDGDRLSGTAVEADVHLELRHDHIVGVPR